MNDFDHRTCENNTTYLLLHLKLFHFFAAHLLKNQSNVQER